MHGRKTNKVELKEKDIWRDIEYYKGAYQVSHLGKVKSLRDNHGNYREKILKQYKDKNGYMHVNLCYQNKNKVVTVHKLVAMTFIPNPNNLPQINHKYEEDKDDNTIYNLEWCTSKYNCNYGTHNMRLSKSLSKTVYQYSLEGDFIKKWDSTIECKQGGYSQSNVSECCRGKTTKYRGYKWSYVRLGGEII